MMHSCWILMGSSRPQQHDRAKISLKCPISEYSWDRCAVKIKHGWKGACLCLCFVCGKGVVAVFCLWCVCGYNKRWGVELCLAKYKGILLHPSGVTRFRAGRFPGTATTSCWL